MALGPRPRPRRSRPEDAPEAMALPLVDDVDWISESYPLSDGRRVHVSVYLVRAPGGNVVVDSGSFYHRDSIRTKLLAATAGQGVQALILSHSDYPHSANIPDFREAWGDFEIVASSGDASVQGLPYARRSRIGETLDVLGRPFTFLDPPLADRSHTTWIYDETSRVMFTADGFGSYHRPKESTLTSLDFADGIRAEDIHDFHRDAVAWLRYVDPDRIMGTLRGMLERWPVRFVAPVHGNPIAEADLPLYLTRLEAAVTRMAAEYRVD